MPGYCVVLRKLSEWGECTWISRICLRMDGVYTIITCLSSVWHCRAVVLSCVSCLMRSICLNICFELIDAGEGGSFVGMSCVGGCQALCCPVKLFEWGEWVYGFPVLLADGCVYTIITCLSSVWHCQAVAVVPRDCFEEGGANLLIEMLVIVYLHVFEGGC